MIFTSKEMNQVVSNVVDVLQELRIDLQDFMWLIAQQLRIDSALVRTSDQVISRALHHILTHVLTKDVQSFNPIGSDAVFQRQMWQTAQLDQADCRTSSIETPTSCEIHNSQPRLWSVHQ